MGHRSEVWSFDVNADESRLITGAGDNELRVWRLSTRRSLHSVEQEEQKIANNEMEESDESPPMVFFVFF